jgi:hypothetical protein
VARRLDGLHDGSRPGAPRWITDEHVERVIEDPGGDPVDAVHWSTRSMAKAGLNPTAVSRIWRAIRFKRIWPKPSSPER